MHVPRSWAPTAGIYMLLFSITILPLHKYVCLLQGMQRFYKMWLEQLQASIHALGGATKPASRGTQRHQVSLLADSAVSSRSFMAPKPLAITSSMISFPVMVVLLGLFLWLLYSNVVLLRRQDMLPRGMLSQAGNLLPPLVPQPSVITENCRLVSESCCL